jgi:hypothetical protein
MPHEFQHTRTFAPSRFVKISLTMLYNNTVAVFQFLLQDTIGGLEVEDPEQPGSFLVSCVRHCPMSSTLERAL